VLVVQAAGYGGGSLVYANVQYRPPADLFDHCWPDGFNRAELDPYYDLVAYMLDICPVAENQPNGLPPKTALMEKVAADLGRSGQFFHPNLAVDFGDPARPRRNKFGVEQTGCCHCGECDIGCNTHAKNTLDLNYLAVAEQHGATVVTECEARHIAKGADGYIVHFSDHASGTDGQVAAPEVFLCAGAVNSTELLLRSRDQHGALPNVSDRLGAGYSGNGDFLAFAFDTSPAPYLPSRGPTITTAIVYDDKSRTDRTWFAFEDGGYPRTAAALLQLMNADRTWLGGADLVRHDFGPAASHARELTDRLAADSDHAAVFLVMGRDRANGTISFLPGGDRICVHWDIGSNLPLYVQESAFCNDVAGALGGRFVANPAWTYLRQPVSVHNLGGCPMGQSPEHGVVDADGEVFGYPGLYVLDGAILPSATGANPSHTIAAVAERCIERAIRRITGNQEWSAPERADAHPITLPEDKITIPAAGTAPPRTPIAGMRFTETMRGTLKPTPAASQPAAASRRRRHAASPAGRAKDGSEEVHAGPKPDGLKASFRVTIASPDLDKFLVDPAHPAAADGTVWVEGYTGPGGRPIVGGLFNLFTDADGLYRRNMLYSLPFHGRNGRHYLLEGHKDVWDHGNFDLWDSTTTLYTTLIDADDPSRPSLATGVLKLNLPMLARQMTTIRITGTGNRVSQLASLSAFGQFFASTLFDVFVRARLDA
jgi:cholesterol oxidase